jgi:hypothetical protein
MVDARFSGQVEPNREVPDEALVGMLRGSCVLRLLRRLLVLLATGAILVVLGQAQALAGGVPPTAPTEASIMLPIARAGAAVTAADTGNVYVTAPQDNEVLALGPDGHVLATVAIPDPQGISVQPGSGTVWVSEGAGDALVSFDQSTFTVSSPESLGAVAACPRALDATVTTIWVAFSCGSSWTSGVAAYPPGSQTVTGATEPITAPITLAPSSDPSVLYAGGGSQIHELDISDPTAGATEIRHSVDEPGGCYNLAAAAFDATAQEVVLACGYPYHHIRLASDLTVAGTYPTAPYPSAVAAADGFVVTGLGSVAPSGDELDVFASAASAPVETFRTADPAYMLVDVTAVSADASTVYAFSRGQSANPGVLESVITAATTPAGKVSAAPVTAPVVGVADQFNGQFTLSDQSTPGATTLTVTRRNPDGSTTALPDVTTTTEGAFSFADTPAQAGQTTWTITYAGDSTHALGSAVVTRTVVLPTPTLTLVTAHPTITDGASDTLTVHLGGHGSNSHVALYVGSTLRATATVNPSGVATFTVHPAATTAYHVAYPGDQTYAPATSKTVTLRVAWKVTETAPGAYAVKSGVHRFHYRGTCVTTHVKGCPAFAAKVAPNAGGKTVGLQLQQRVGGRWLSLFDRDIKLSPKGSCKLTIYYASKAAIGHLLRARIAPIAAKGGLVAVTPTWLELDVTA